MGFDPVRAQLASDYLRISSMTLWTFEVIQTLPAEYRIYRKAIQMKRLSLGVRMFILVRYLGTLAMITSAVGYFGRDYSTEFCIRYQHVAPLTKVASGLANQAVFFWRTYAISGSKPWVFRTMSVAYICAMTMQIYANSTTIPLQNDLNNCIAAAGPGFRVSWLYYLAAILYDFIVLGISYYYLSGAAVIPWRDMYSFTKSLLAQGIVYVLLASFMNAINLTFFELTVATSVSGMFATLGVAVTSLASQRIILNLLDPMRKPSSFGRSTMETQTGLGFAPVAARTIGGSVITGRSTHEIDLDDSHMEMGKMQVAVQIDVDRDSNGALSDPFDSHSKKKSAASLV